MHDDDSDDEPLQERLVQETRTEEGDANTPMYVEISGLYPGKKEVMTELQSGGSGSTPAAEGDGPSRYQDPIVGRDGRDNRGYVEDQVGGLTGLKVMPNRLNGGEDMKDLMRAMMELQSEVKLLRGRSQSSQPQLDQEKDGAHAGPHEPI